MAVCGSTQSLRLQAATQSTGLQAGNVCSLCSLLDEGRKSLSVFLHPSQSAWPEHVPALHKLCTYTLHIRGLSLNAGVNVAAGGHLPCPCMHAAAVPLRVNRAHMMAYTASASA